LNNTNRWTGHDRKSSLALPTSTRTAKFVERRAPTAQLFAAASPGGRVDCSSPVRRPRPTPSSASHTARTERRSPTTALQDFGNTLGPGPGTDAVLVAENTRRTTFFGGRIGNGI